MNNTTDPTPTAGTSGSPAYVDPRVGKLTREIAAKTEPPTLERAVDTAIRTRIEEWWRAGKINHTHTVADAEFLVADVIRAVRAAKQSNSPRVEGA